MRPPIRSRTFPRSRTTTIRAALYARYSSDRQNDRSVEDQLALCRRHAEAKGWGVVASFSDAAISGAAMANRPGLIALLATAAAGAFDVLVVEDTDRLARNREHDAHVYNRLTFAGVTIATPATDKVTVIESALKGLMNELYLVNLGAHTARGMRANAERGAATGSRLYGYRSAPGGAVAIVEAEAEVVREIFTRFAAGETARQIAADLNRRAVPGARGGAWNAGQINGSRQRRNGVLYTEAYAGVKVYGRMSVAKHPDTGARAPRMKPPAEWLRVPAEHLRILSAPLWNAAQARKAAESTQSPGQISARRRGLLSGLLKCGGCGAGYVSFSAARLVCAAHREKGEAICANRAMPRRAAIEDRVLKALRARLATPEAAEAYAAAYQAAWAEQGLQARARRTPIERRIAELHRREARICEAYICGAAPMASLAKAKAHEAERAELQAELAAIDAREGAPPPAIALHPAAPAAYGRLIETLHGRLAEAAADPAARPLIDALRALVIRIDLHPDPAQPDGVAITLTGDLARFLDPPDRWVNGGSWGRDRPGSQRSLPVEIAA